jgi:hypothetical protein
MTSLVYLARDLRHQLTAAPNLDQRTVGSETGGALFRCYSGDGVFWRIR